MKINKTIIFLAIIVMISCTFANAFQTASAVQNKPKTADASTSYITADELKTKIANNEQVCIVDLRGPTIYAQAEKTVKGAVHTKVRRVVYRLREIPRDQEVVVYCDCPSDEAAIIGARNLMAGGFKRVRVLKGGWNAWRQVGGQMTPRPR